MLSEIKSKYILKVGAHASRRLNLLHSLHGKYSRQFLKPLKEKKSLRILDIGCGIGHMSCWLGKFFHNSIIVGVDNSECQLNLARKRARKMNIKNVKFEQNDLENLNKFDMKFDVIYSRYCLIHVSNPLTVLKNLKEILAPSGRLIIEEPTISTAFCYPINTAYEISRFLLNRLARIKGLDFELGKKIENVLHNLNFEIERCKLIQPLLENERERQLLFLLTSECENLYIANNLATNEYLQYVMEGLKKLANEKGTLIAFPRTTQICAINNDR